MDWFILRGRTFAWPGHQVETWKAYQRFLIVTTVASLYILSRQKFDFDAWLFFLAKDEPFQANYIYFFLSKNCNVVHNRLEEKKKKKVANLERSLWEIEMSCINFLSFFFLPRLQCIYLTVMNIRVVYDRWWRTSDEYKSIR